ncbi:MAG: HEAT repeat domain-containing protein, partial [Planctomycetes bacterium]|nr:HEAT repeat domain-containing protein [Planctomycetota bacterium]
VKHPMYAEKTVPFLRGMLANDDEEKIRAAVADALGVMGRDLETIEVLISAIQDDDPYVRRAAIQALGTIGPKAASAIPALQKLVNQNPSYDWFIDEANAALELIEHHESTIPDS